MNILKMLLSIGSSFLFAEIEKASIEQKNQKRIVEIKQESKDYIEDIYKKFEDKYSNDIKNLIIVSRFLLIGFTFIIILLIALIILFITNTMK